MSRQQITPTEYLDKMLDIIRANGIPLSGQAPTVNVIRTTHGAGTELSCDKRDLSTVRDAFKAVGQTYTAQPQFLPDWNLL
ncbi:hypothetical protein ACOTD7_19215 [Achromobacter xylosoxidans]